jgi:hypothetical protein
MNGSPSSIMKFDFLRVVNIKLGVALMSLEFICRVHTKVDFSVLF